MICPCFITGHVVSLGNVFKMSNLLDLTAAMCYLFTFSISKNEILSRLYRPLNLE